MMHFKYATLGNYWYTYKAYISVQGSFLKINIGFTPEKTRKILSTLLGVHLNPKCFHTSIWSIISQLC